MSFEKRILYTVDWMDDEMLYPIQAKENQCSNGYAQTVNIGSSDGDLAKIIDGR